MPRKGRNIFNRKDGRWERLNGRKAVFGKSCPEVKHKKAEAVSQLDTVQSQLKKQKRAKNPLVAQNDFLS